MRTHVFADMMGYARLVEDRPAADVVRYLVAYDRIVRGALPSKRAEVDRAADVFRLVFSTPSEAVLTAIKIAEAVGRHNARNPDLAMRVKFGIGIMRSFAKSSSGTGASRSTPPAMASTRPLGRPHGRSNALWLSALASGRSHRRSDRDPRRRVRDRRG